MEGIKISGYVRLRIKDKDGNIKEDTGFQKNIITNAGLAELSNLAGNVSSPTAFTYLAVGTDNTAAAATDTTLGAEITDTGLARASATVSRTTTTATNDTLRLVYEWTAAGS